jgi:hypothetical protein
MDSLSAAAARYRSCDRAAHACEGSGDRAARSGASPIGPGDLVLRQHGADSPGACRRAITYRQRSDHGQRGTSGQTASTLPLHTPPRHRKGRVGLTQCARPISPRLVGRPATSPEERAAPPRCLHQLRNYRLAAARREPPATRRVEARVERPSRQSLISASTSFVSRASDSCHPT